MRIVNYFKINRRPIHGERPIWARKSDVTKSRVFLVSIFLLLAYMLASAFNLLFSDEIPIIFLLIYCAHLAYLFSCRLFFFKYLWIIVMMSWMVIADAILVCRPLWLNELQNMTFNNGSLGCLCIATSIMLQFILLLEIRRGSRDEVIRPSRNMKQGSVLYRAAGIIALIIISLAFISVVTQPSWISATDRFDYAANILSEFLRSYQVYLILLVPMAYPCLKVGAKGIFCAVVSIYALYLVWTGEKFTSLFLLCYILILGLVVPRLVGLNATEITSKTRALIGSALAIGLAFVALVLIQYMFQFGSSNATTVLEQRIASQGEVWWGTYNIVSESGIKPGELADELAFLSAAGDTDAARHQGGIYKLMQLVMPGNYYTMYMDRSIRLSSSTPATFYYYFGIVGLVIGLIICAAIYYLIINKTVQSLINGRILESMLCVYLIRIMHGVLIMSDFCDLFSYRTIAAVGLLILLALIHRDPLIKHRASNCPDRGKSFPVLDPLKSTEGRG